VKIKKIKIKNFRSLYGLEINVGNMLSLIGHNNVGKSNLIKAIKLFRDGTKSDVETNCFYNNDTDNPIIIEVHFNQLSDEEKQKFSNYLCDNELITKKKIEYRGNDKYDINYICNRDFARK